MEGQVSSKPRTSKPYRLQTTPNLKRVVKFSPWVQKSASDKSLNSSSTLSGISSTGNDDKPVASTGRRSTGAFLDPRVYGRSTVGTARHDSLLAPIRDDLAMRKITALPQSTELDVLGYSNLPLNVTIHLPETTQLPEWYIELTPQQDQLFNQMLRLLDDHSFSEVSRKELLEMVKQINEDITQSELDEIISKIQNQSPNRQVDFDEFLFALANRERKKMIKEIGKDEYKSKKKVEPRRYSLVQKIYYSAIARFSVLGAVQSPLQVQRKHWLREVRAPHALGHFLHTRTRKQGRSKRELRRMMMQMLKDAKGQFSPYIHPLPFVRLDNGRPRRPHQCPRMKPDNPDEGQEEDPQMIQLQGLSPLALLALRKLSAGAAETKDSAPNAVVDEGEIYLDDSDIDNVLKVYKENGSVAARLPDIQRAPGMQDMLARISIYDSLSSSKRKRKETIVLLRQRLQELQMEDPQVLLERRRKNRVKFFMPHVRRFLVPLPTFRPTRCEILHPTPVNIANMHKRMQNKLADYRWRLKLSHVYHAWNLLERINLEKLPESCRERFLQIYRAYEPLKLRDIFVISPYAPHITYID